jgi:hypothetical protein
MSVREKVGGGFIGTAWMIMPILGLFIHFWSIVIALSISGIFSAMVTFVLPVVSTIFWFFKVGFNVGFDNFYCLSILGYIGLMIIFFAGMVIAGNSD